MIYNLCCCIDRLCNSSLKVLAKAEELCSQGDEENAYIMYMKYFDLISTIKAAKDFHKFRSKLGTEQQIYGRLDVLTKLSDSLIKR